MNDYRAALRYLLSFTNFEAKPADLYAPAHFDLSRMERLLARLGNPHLAFDVVHVAGTKGKGSTAAMTAAVLREAGYRTGLYTSPHLHTFRERLRVDEQLIPADALAALVGELQPHAATVENITTFELLTALAFLYFARREVELAVLEVGLGGRLDATNVVRPRVSVITSISYDHTQILGDTLAQIATEKAGIVKPGVPVVSAPQAPEALAVIEATCRERAAPLVVVGRDWTWKLEQTHAGTQTFTVESRLPCPMTASLTGTAFEIPLLGRHQLENATVVVATVAELVAQNYEISSAHLQHGLANVRWPGRLEVLGRAPLVIVDGAHNGYSAQTLVAVLRELFTFDNLILVFGSQSDKDIAGMLRALVPGAARVILTQSKHPRAASLLALQEQLRPFNAPTLLSEDVADGLAHAVASASRRDLVLVTGSLFVVAEARAAWFAQHGQAIETD